MMNLLNDYLTRAELADELRVTQRTILRWQNRPDGIPFIALGGRILYRRDSVMSWLKGLETWPNARGGKR